jgi:uncharacterized protein
LKNRNECIDIVCSALKKEFSPQLIYLFGSFAANKENDSSDIDVAILCEKRIDPVKLFDFQLSLGYLVNRDVDLIDLNNTDILFKMQIISSRYPIYESSSEFRYEFEMKAISEYVKFNEEREIIFEKKLGVSGGGIWKLF